MFVRNLALLAIFSPRPSLIALWPISMMAVSAAAFAWWQHRTPQAAPSLTLGSPFEIRNIASFGLLFVTIQLAASLSQRFFGSYGTIGVSILGGFVSSASTTAAAASLPTHGRISPSAAAISTVVASIASTVINIPIIYRETRDTRLLRTLLAVSAAIAVLGLAVLGAVEFISRRMSIPSF
jgi:uncharacterized membrane protein (DUF4010 family)